MLRLGLGHYLGTLVHRLLDQSSDSVIFLTILRAFGLLSLASLLKLLLF